MYLVDRLSYSSRLNGVHPVEKALLSAGLLTASFASGNCYISSGIFLLAGIITLNVTGIKASSYMKLLSIPFLFILSGIITIMVNINENLYDPLLSFSMAGVKFAVSRESLASGFSIFVKAFSSVSCLYLFILTTPVSEFEYLLKKMRVADSFREMFILVYRFIFIVADMAEKITISQRSRMGYSSFRNRISSTGMLASAVLVKSFFFSRNSYQALAARGYDGELNIIDDDYRFSGRNILIITGILIFIFAFVIWCR